MSTQITTAFVKQYSDNVFHLVQQSGSRLRQYTRNETQNGDSKFFERIGSTAAQIKSGRHSDTPLMNTPHSRRMVTLADYEWADLIDDADKIRMLIDPTSEYALAARNAMGRSMDDVIIAAALGNAFGGVGGTSVIAHPNSQKLASTNGTDAGASLNVSALRNARQILMANEVDPDEELYIAADAKQIKNMLTEVEVTSHDYNSVKALVEGKVDTFMGFKFVHSERLNVQSGALSFAYADGTVGSGSGDADTYRRCFAWAKSGLVLSTGTEIMGKISERDDKSYSTQVYAAMGIGATRLEEEKIVEILCVA